MAITKEHLLAACDDAERATEAPIDTPAGPRRYCQSLWDCGSACCIHGFARLRAYGKPARGGPNPEDYSDLPDDILDGVLSVLWSQGGTPDLVRRVLSRDIRIGSGARIGRGATIGSGAAIGDVVMIGPGVRVAPGEVVSEDRL